MVEHRTSRREADSDRMRRPPTQEEPMAHRLVDIPSLTALPECTSRTTRRPARSRAALGCVVTAALLVAGVGPASAERVRSSDGAGDMTAFTESAEDVTATPAPGHRAGDVTSAVVRHGRRVVTLRFSFAQLRRSHFNALIGTLRTDTTTRHLFVEDAPDGRPRLYMADKRFEPVCARATLRVDYQANTLAVRVPRSCLKRPQWVKVRAISANDTADGSNTFYLDDAFSPTPVEDIEGRAAWSARVERG